MSSTSYFLTSIVITAIVTFVILIIGHKLNKDNTQDYSKAIAIILYISLLMGCAIGGMLNGLVVIAAGVESELIAEHDVQKVYIDTELNSIAYIEKNGSNERHLPDSIEYELCDIPKIKVNQFNTGFIIMGEENTLYLPIEYLNSDKLILYEAPN